MLNVLHVKVKTDALGEKKPTNDSMGLECALCYVCSYRLNKIVFLFNSAIQKEQCVYY